MTKQIYKALAIDGGGTKCRLALVSDTGFEAVVSGSANASSDFDGTVHSITLGLDSLASHLSMPLQTITDLPAYVGAAGVVDAFIAERLRAALPFTHMKIEDDRPSALCGALGLDDGLIAHCGTGSFFAAQNKGVQKFVGGWGPRLDDVGAAYWIGMRALTETLYAFDALVAHSDMTEALLKEYGGTGAIVSYAAHASPIDIAQLAQHVTWYAEQDDANAIRILKQGASLVAEKLTQLGWSEGKTVCLTGGLAGHYKPYLSASLQSDVAHPKGEPLDGAVVLARKLLMELSA